MHLSLRNRIRSCSHWTCLQRATRPRRSSNASSESQGDSVRRPPIPAALGALLPLLVLCLSPACDDGGGGGSSGGQAKAPPGSPERPAKLAGEFVRQAHSTIHLVWEDNSEDELGFRIERQLYDREWQPLGNVGIDVTTYEDETWEWDTKYHFRVRAWNTAGESRYTRTNITTPEGGGGCGITLGEALTPSGPWASISDSVSNVAGALQGVTDRVWFWALHPEEEVVARSPHLGTGRTIRLDGGRDGTLDLLYERREIGARVELELTLVFHPFTAKEDGHVSELCLSFHDLARGDYETSGLHSSQRGSVVAQLPFSGPFPIEPGREYRASIRIDRARGRFDVSVDGLALATDVPLDGVLVVPAVYMHP